MQPHDGRMDNFAPPRLGRWVEMYSIQAKAM
jgi:hypothetical protein